MKRSHRPSKGSGKTVLQSGVAKAKETQAEATLKKNVINVLFLLIIP